MSSPRTNLLIAYGTTTGTAREVAVRIAREAYSFTLRNDDKQSNAHFFSPEVLSMKELTVQHLVDNWTGSESKVIFVISTTGQGEFPEEAKPIWRDLCRKTVTPEISIKYAVVGLGDSSYELYNYPGKKLHRRLEQLKGVPCFELCLCDDQHDLGYVGALNAFLERCWASWVPREYRAARNSQPVARYTLLQNEADGSASPHGAGGGSDQVKVQKRPVMRNERVTALDHSQDTRLIAFDTTNCSFDFEEGDAIQVYAENFPENVELFFEIFPGLRNQPPFYIHCDPDMRWEQIPPQLFQLCGPQPWTWEQIATQLLDLQGIPGTYLFEVLRCFVSDPLIQEKFDDYCRPEGLEELYNYINRPRRTVLEVLKDFSTEVANLPPNYIFDLIQFMRPRAFSIASPPKESHHIEILVAVVEYRTNLKKMRKGTCSYWLAHHCLIGHPVGICCERGSLRPPKTDCHMLMIGPGTGVAPFRSMIKQHSKEWDKHLFFGCRNKEKDYYFGAEFEAMVQDGDLSLYKAFSRDNQGRKVDYVQDVILREVGLVKSMLESPLPLYIYVCGRSGDMPKDVFNAFKQILQEIGVTNSDAFLKQMLLTGQYQTETY